MLPMPIADDLSQRRDDDPEMNNMHLRYARLMTGDPEAYRPAVSCLLEFASAVRRRLAKAP
jgi:hypothetical protein